MLGKVRNWVTDRAEVGPEGFQALNRGLPKGVGWLNTLGSAAMALIALQVITGVFLAMYYSPHPDAAYETIRFIDHLPAGRLVRGLHFYGESALVIVVFLHLLRTYFHAAYKPPRELVWITGIVLLVLVLGFGFTGYLLPWDQNAFNATQARTEYAAGVPVFGPILLVLLRGSSNVGALTLTRFYAIHILLLPILLLILLQAHLVVAWRKGPTPPGVRVGETAPVVTRFIEGQLLRDAVAIFVVFCAVYAMAFLRPVELEFKANPSDASYHPHPEWYFLSLFQFVTDFGKLPGIGKVSFIPVMVIPGLVMTFFLLAPWIDRSPERKASKRPLMVAAMVLVLLIATGFTLRAYALLRPNATPSNSLFATYAERGEAPLKPDQVAKGVEAFRAMGCGGCHVAYHDFSPPKPFGPDLSGYGLRTIPLVEISGHPEIAGTSYHDRFVKFVRGELRPPPEEDRMPKYAEDRLPPDQLEAIGAYLSQDPSAVLELKHLGPKGSVGPGKDAP
jgi:ubiquinol-cytochrome c reductase cytochrome b subunit